MIALIVSIAAFTLKSSLTNEAIYENVTQTIVNACGDWGDHDRLDRPCSIRAIGRRPGRS